jgi:hypothetical protein
MDRVWIGRMLILASPALQERYLKHAAQIGIAAAPVGELAGNFLRQIGLALITNDAIETPFARTRGVVRVSAELSAQDFARAYAGLWTLVADYLQNLPGVGPDIAHVVRRMIRQAGVVTVDLLRRLRHGESTAALASQFGGMLVLAFPRV